MTENQLQWGKYRVYDGIGIIMSSTCELDTIRFCHGFYLHFLQLNIYLVKRYIVDARARARARERAQMDGNLF